MAILINHAKVAEKILAAGDVVAREVEDGCTTDEQDVVHVVALQLCTLHKLGVISIIVLISHCIISFLSVPEDVVKWPGTSRRSQ